MRVVVCIKQVPGTTKVEVDEKTGVLKRNGVDSKMNPYDLYALETALRIKETQEACVEVISMGPPQAEAIIKEALMMGVDDGVLLSDRKFAGADVLATSYAIYQGVEKMGMPELIICGKQTTDGDTAQVGPELAEFLCIPHVTNVKKILEIQEDRISVEIDMADFIQVAEIKFPCLITVDKDIYQPRLPSYKRKMKMKEQGIRVFSLTDFADRDENMYGMNGSPTKVERIFPPAANENREIWKGSGDELTEKLYTKLKESKFI